MTRDYTRHTDTPGWHDTDSGGNCRETGCFYNADEAKGAAEARGEDIYGHVPEEPTCGYVAENGETCPRQRVPDLDRCLWHVRFEMGQFREERASRRTGWWIKERQLVYIELNARNKAYGRASHTIGQLRNEVAALRARLRDPS
jgi:hypothetical protein